MNSSIIWIILPAITAILLWFVGSQRLSILLGIGISIMLSFLALILPIDSLITIFGLTFKISSEMTILGRQLILDTTNQPMLFFLYFSISIWFLCNLVTNSQHKLTPYSLLIVSLLISALVVKPFLYASLLIQIAILISIPLLRNSSTSTGRGIIRFITYQTFSLPFILLSGWLLTGVAASPEDLSLTSQASLMLGLGFIFLLSIFPFNNWIPILAEEVHPLSSAFILWIFPTTGLLFGCYFLDSYAWIRDSFQLSVILQYSGITMVAMGGIWAAFQKNLKRMFAYAMIMETGYSLIAINLREVVGMQLFFDYLVIRTITVFLWTSALSIILKHLSSADFVDIKSLAYKHPFSAMTIIICQLSFVGLPILAGFPNQIVLWGLLSKISLPLTGIFLLAGAGLSMGALRSLAVMLVSPNSDTLVSGENTMQKIFLAIGVLLIIILGLFPMISDPLISKLPLMFSHLN
ncbi:proton-conducting transporter membrane subunit [Chloroflexota bacterium]